MKIYKKIRSFISENKLIDAIKLMEGLCKNYIKLDNQRTLLASQLNELNQKEKNNLVKEENVRVEKNKLIIRLLDLVEELEEINDYQILDLVNKNDIEFLKELELENVSKILLIGHTGRNHLTSFQRHFEDLDYFYKPQIRILLRNPYDEAQRRFEQVHSSINNVVKRFRDEGYDIDLNFYGSIPNIRAIICEYENGKRISYISYYLYRPQKRSKAWDKGFVVEDSVTEKNGLVSFVENWFESFYGKEEIHTIVFDFDDTLADTMNLQVEAWCNTVKKLILENKINLNYLEEEIRLTIDNQNGLFEKIKEIFLTNQMALRIKEAIFKNVPTEKFEAIENEIKSYRFKERVRLTKTKAKLFPQVKDTLEKLSQKYQLAIISSTSEALIRQILREHKILNYFTDIYGKYGPKSAWENIEDKSEKLIKLSKKLGVPLERMIYIGDNNTDYKGTKQLSLKFIEARIQSSKEGRDSFIKYPKNTNPLYFESYESGKLFEIIETLNKELKHGKENLNIQFLKK